MTLAGGPSVEPADGYLPDTPWTYPDPLWVYLGGFIATLLAFFPLATRYGDAGVPTWTQIAVLLPAQSIGMAFVVVALWRIRDPRPLGVSLGLRLHLADWWALFFGVALQIGAAVLLTGLRELLPLSDTPEQGVAESLQAVEGVPVELIALLVVVVAAPVLEEIMFRGMLLSRLTRSFDKHVAVAIAAVAFAASHVVGDPSAWFASIALVPIGIALGYLALSGKDLSRPIWAHAGVNLLGAIALIFLDDLQRLQDDLQQSVQTVLRLFG